jgi:predicted TIM-barrel fold metal-dependent hydrolase
MTVTHRIYSCDDHLDIFNLPHDVWTARAPERLREQVPHVKQHAELDKQFWHTGDRPMSPAGGIDKGYMATARLDLPDDGYRASNPQLRLEDMDLDGIHASVIYGPGSLFGFPIDDPEVKVATARGWNDWAATEFNAHAPDRLCALPFLPTTTPEDAAAEVERCAGLGHRGAILHVHQIDLRDPAWDRLWSAAGASQMPISFHIGGGASLITGPKSGTWEMAAFSAVAPMQLDEPLAVMIFGGILDRNRSFQLVLAEAGVGWLPYFVARMDASFQKHSKTSGFTSDQRLPSEIFREQVFATFEEEPLGKALLPLLGDDNIMWASDYPHTDSTFPWSRKAVDELAEGLSPESVRKVTGENCRRLYRLP